MHDLIAGGPFDSGRRLDVRCPLCRRGHHALALTVLNSNFSYRCTGKTLMGGYGFGEPTDREPLQVSVIEDDRGKEDR